jgi:hypothetical protein
MFDVYFWTKALNEVRRRASEELSPASNDPLRFARSRNPGK